MGGQKISHIGKGGRKLFSFIRIGSISEEGLKQFEHVSSLQSVPIAFSINGLSSSKGALLNQEIIIPLLRRGVL